MIKSPSLLYLLVALILTGCQSTESILSKDQFTLKGDYGSIAYDGFGTRINYENHVTFVIDELKLEYVENAKTNSIPVAELENVRLSATARPASGKGRWNILYEDYATINVTLSKSKLSKTIKRVKLSIPRSIVEEADQVGLSLVGERLLWPMRPKLKYVEQVGSYNAGKRPLLSQRTQQNNEN